MDATPSFGVTKIPEVPSNPQLTLVLGMSHFIIEFCFNESHYKRTKDTYCI